MTPERERLRLSELQAKNRTGLVCPRCGCADLRVVWTRRVRAGIRRLRVCRFCGDRFPTTETA